MGVPPPFGERDDRGWDQGDRDIYPKETEYDGALHSYMTHHGPMPRCGEEAGVAGTEAVVGA